jgi:hypothetical protein
VLRMCSTAISRMQLAPHSVDFQERGASRAIS